MSIHGLSEGSFNNPGRCSTPRRIVRVFVTDSDKDVPLKDCVLFESSEMRTDETDSELFLGLEPTIPQLLKTHNEVRRGLQLKEIRARDLRMAVATLVYI